MQIIQTIYELRLTLKNQAKIDAENNTIYNEKYKPVIEAKVASFATLKATSVTTKSGLQFKITKKGSGKFKGRTGP